MRLDIIVLEQTLLIYTRHEDDEISYFFHCDSFLHKFYSVDLAKILGPIRNPLFLLEILFDHFNLFKLFRISCNKGYYVGRVHIQMLD